MKQRYLISTLVCLGVAYLVLHPVTRRFVLALFPFFAKSWSGIASAMLLAALVFGLFYLLSVRFRSK